MKNKHVKRLLLSGMALGLVVSFAYSQTDKSRIYIYGGLSKHMQYGTVDDYVPGVNDFPVNPSHFPYSLGGALTVFFTQSLALEVDGRLASSSMVKLEDPSDQDTLEMNTSKHLSLSINLVYQFSLNKFRPYLLAGAGVDKMLAFEETYISEFGYEITTAVPIHGDLIEPVIQAGGGILFFISKDIGIRADLRYARIFHNSNHMNSVTAVFGIVIDI